MRLALKTDKPCFGNDFAGIMGVKLSVMMRLPVQFVRRDDALFVGSSGGRFFSKTRSGR